MTVHFVPGQFLFSQLGVTCLKKVDGGSHGWPFVIGMVNSAEATSPSITNYASNRLSVYSQ